MRSRISGRGSSSVSTPIAPSSASSARGMRVGVVGVQLQQRLTRGHPLPHARPSSTTPAAADTGSSLRARPAPSRQAATPRAKASSRVSVPPAGAVTTCVSAGLRQRRVRVPALGGDHPRARRPSPGRRPARRRGRRPRARPRRASPGPAPGSARRRRPARRRRAPRPTRPPRRALPTARPSGRSIAVTSATVRTPARLAEPDHRAGQLARGVGGPS